MLGEFIEITSCFQKVRKSFPLTLCLCYSLLGGNLFAKDPSSLSSTVSLGSSTVDGDYSEWDLTADFFADMHKAGKGSKDILAKSYLTYDCDNEVLYVMVLVESPGEYVVDDVWLKVYDLQKSPLFDEGEGNDGVPADFSWIIDPNTSQKLGFEASVSLSAADYEEIQISMEVYDGKSSENASTGKGGKGGSLPYASLPLATSCSSEASGGNEVETGNCSLDLPTLSLVCDDQGTNNLSDDTYNVLVTQTGTAVSGTFSISSKDGSVNASGLSYGVEHTLGPYNFTSGVLFFTVTDDSNSSCTLEKIKLKLSEYCGDEDGDGIPSAVEGDGDFDGDGVPNYLDFDPQGFLYDEDTGDLVTGGSISVTGTDINGDPVDVGLINIVKDGSDGEYQFFAPEEGTYTMAITYPTGFELSPNCAVQLGTFTNPNNDGNSGNDPDVVIIGSQDSNNDDVLDNYTCGANDYYFTFYIQAGDLILANNIPLSSIQSLPIELSSVSTFVYKGNEVFLSWETLSETNNDFFTVERSQDAEKWNEVTRVEGAGTSEISQKYRIEDPRPLSGTSYYRLKQTDYNGQSTISQIMEINIKPINGRELSIYPNPTQGEITLEGSLELLESFHFYDIQGKDVRSKLRVVEESDFHLTLDLFHLPKGFYILETINDTIKVTKN